MREWRDKRFEPLNIIKSDIGCYYCDENNFVCLDWHHVDPKTKKFTIGKTTMGYNTLELLEEAAKCEVVCANCHRKLHRKILEKPTKIRPRLRTLLEVALLDQKKVHLEEF